jgi:aryl-alcohol dehydrogenase
MGRGALTSAPMKTEAAVSRQRTRAPQIETLDVDAPRAHEVLVRMVASGVCHTDLMIHGDADSSKPMVLGHEGAGIVERVGEGVPDLARGDHVVLAADSCGRCPMCRRNLTSYCIEGMELNFGGKRPGGVVVFAKGKERIGGRFFGQSSFSRFSVVAERSVVKVDKDVPLEIVAPMGCGVITGAGSVMNALKVGHGQSIAIFGAGGVGLSAVMAARLVGAAHIIAIDVQPARLKLARELGATETIDAKKHDAVKAIRDICPYGVEFSYNTTEAPKTYTQALECLAMRGVAGFVTTPDGEWKPDPWTMLSGGRSLRGIIGGDAVPQLFIPELIAYWRQGRFPLDKMIRYYPFEKIADAFRDSGHAAVKPVLRME